MKPKREPMASYSNAKGAATHACDCKPSFRKITLLRGRGIPRTETHCTVCGKRWTSEGKTASARTF
jgi:hypothetical protein